MKKEIKYILSIVALLVIGNTAYAKKCYFQTMKVGNQNYEMVSQTALALFSKYVEPVKSPPSSGFTEKGNCFYEMNITETRTRFFISITGDSFNLSGNSKKEGFDGIQQALLRAIIREKPDKKREICNAYMNLLHEDCVNSSQNDFQRKKSVEKGSAYSTPIPDDKFILESELRSKLPTNSIFKIELSPKAGASFNFSKDGKMLVIDQNDKIILWSVSSGQQLRVLSDKHGSFSSATFSKDGHSVVGVAHWRLIMFDVTSGQVKDRVKLEHYDGIISTSPFGNYFALGSGHQIVFYTYPDLEVKRTLKIGFDKLKLVFNKNRKILAVGGASNEIKIFNPKNGWVLKTLKVSQHNSFYGKTKVTSLAFSYDGKFLVAGQKNGYISLFNVITGREIRNFNIVKRGDNKVESVTFSPDGKFLAAGGIDENSNGVVVVWDTKTGDILRKIDFPLGTVKRIQFSPDGTFLAVAHGRTITFFGE